VFVLSIVLLPVAIVGQDTVAVTETNTVTDPSGPLQASDINIHAKTSTIHTTNATAR